MVVKLEPERVKRVQKMVPEILKPLSLNNILIFLSEDGITNLIHLLPTESNIIMWNYVYN